MKKENPQISRRDFIKGAAAGAVSMAAMGVLGACSDTAGNTNLDTNTAAVETTALQTPGNETATTSAVNVMSAGSDTMNAEMYAKKWDFEIAPDPITDEEISEVVDAEIVVVGAGTAGLCTACSASENGADVVLISASSAPVSRGGSNHAIYSRLMEAEGISRYNVDMEFRKELAANAGKADERKWYKFYNNSEEATNWLLDIMEDADCTAVLETVPRLYPEGDPMYIAPASHAFISDEIPMAGLGQPLVVNRLAEYFIEKGGRIYYNTIGKQLIREDNNTGRVSAIVALKEDGSYTKYTASKGIVLATGDFTADKEMVTKYCPEVAHLMKDVEINYDVGLACNGIYAGEGHKMGLWVGAAWQRSYPNAPMVIGGSFCAQPSLSFTGLLVDKNGERFSNEKSIFSISGNKNLMQTDSASFGIWGTNYAKDGGPWVKPNTHIHEDPYTEDEIIQVWDEAAKAGVTPSGGDTMSKMVKADTIEEVIALLGLPESTIETVNRYNELCEKGGDEDFHKTANLMIPIKDGPFYGAGGGGTTVLTIMGGLRTNAKMQVCEEDDTPIPGLYNVGVMVGDMYGSYYSFMLQGFNYGATCITFGYLTGRDLAASES